MSRRITTAVSTIAIILIAATLGACTPAKTPASDYAAFEKRVEQFRDEFHADNDPVVDALAANNMVLASAAAGVVKEHGLALLTWLQDNPAAPCYALAHEAAVTLAVGVGDHYGFIEEGDLESAADSPFVDGLLALYAAMSEVDCSTATYPPAAASPSASPSAAASAEG